MKKTRFSLSVIILLIVTVFSLNPFYIMMIGAFKTQMALRLTPPDLNPFQNMILANWNYVAFNSKIWQWLLNSITLGVFVSLITVFIAACGGYAFAKKKFHGSGVLFAVIIATMILPRQMLLIPNFLVAQNLGLKDSMIGLILTTVTTPFGIFLCRQFMVGIPTELIEAAEIDGCHELNKFASIIVPLSLPVLGALAIFSFLASWNDYLWQLIMISTESKYTITIGIAFFAQATQTNVGRQMMAAFIATIPILIMFLSFQKVFIKGITMGGVKG